MLMGSVIRSVQTAGALETILSLCVAYAGERVAFERPIGKFQAVQQNLARLAGEVAAALAVSGSAADAIAQARALSTKRCFLKRQSAKIRSAEAAAEGAAIAHQVFGAIGFTQEHVLHRFTLRMLSWRDDFGNESYWAAELGRRVAARAPTSSGHWWRRDDHELQFDPVRLPRQCEALRRRRARVSGGGDRRRHLRSAPSGTWRLRTAAISATASAPRVGSG